MAGKKCSCFTVLSTVIEAIARPARDFDLPTCVFVDIDQRIEVASIPNFAADSG
jgi:hypothetical protein